MMLEVYRGERRKRKGLSQVSGKGIAGGRTKVDGEESTRECFMSVLLRQGAASRLMPQSEWEGRELLLLD